MLKGHNYDVQQDVSRLGTTDAEGRLFLADAISTPQNYKPELIIDIATLTGQQVVHSPIRPIAMILMPTEVYKLLEESGQSI